MRRLALACSFLGSLLAAGCAPSGPELVDETQDPIAFGTQDTIHNAVVSLLAPAGGGSFTECSGSIVKVANGQAYVLTAAHCCKDGAPTIVVRSTDYSIGEQYIFGGTPPAGSNVYKVVAGSAYWDSQYTANNGYDHDFCMLKFSGATSTLPTLALPTSANDGVGNGVAIEHVGFGMTNKNPNNSLRYTGTDNVSSYNTTTISYQQGGSNPTGSTGIPGPCEGDSGGPALIPAGAGQSQQTIVGVTSFGQTQTCGALDTGTSSRVSSVIGTGKFITNYLNDTPSGTLAGQSAGDCNSCQQAAQSGACASQANACANDPKCIQLSQCYGNCSTQSCYTNCQTQAGTQAVNELNNYSNCICNTGCVTECATECGGSSSSSSGGSGCGLQASDPTCNTCLTNSCCNQASACAGNQTCVDCLSNQTTACNSNPQFVSIVQCLQGNCATPCGLSSSSSSSSTSSSGNTSTSSSSGGNTSTSSSTSAGGIVTSSSGGAGGAGSGGAGSGGDGNGNGDNDQESGCSVGAAGSDPGSAASLAGMLIGLAIAASRRRRAS